jgi:signal transduction histidine kinase
LGAVMTTSAKTSTHDNMHVVDERADPPLEASGFHARFRDERLDGHHHHARPGLASTAAKGSRSSVPPPLDTLIALDDLLRGEPNLTAVFPQLVERLRAVWSFPMVGLGYDDVGACSSTTLSACDESGLPPSSGAGGHRDAVHNLLRAARQYFNDEASLDEYAACVAASGHRWICLPITTDDGIVHGVLIVATDGDSAADVGDSASEQEKVAFIAVVARQLGHLLTTELRMKEVARAKAAIAERDELLSTVSHDLGNPLNVILMSASVLLRNNEGGDAPADANANANDVTTAAAAPAPGARSQIQAIDRNARRMRRLVNDLVDMGSIEAGNLSMLPRRCHPRQLLDDALIDTMPLAMQKGITLTVDYDDTWVGSSSSSSSSGTFFVWADGERIVQVLTNIVANAIKFTPSGGRVVLAGRRLSRDSFSFAVCDTGRGIRPADVPRIFDRYWRSEETKSRTGSSGLGLSICKSLVELSGGQIAASSVVGQGTTIVFTLPIADGRTD